MNKTTIGIVLLAIGFGACTHRVNVSNAFAYAEKQTQVMLQQVPLARAGKSDLISPRTLENGELKLVASRDWTSGFFAGQLWYLYEQTGKDLWKNEAKAYTQNIEREKTNGGTHDMGFKVYCSFGNGYRLLHDDAYKSVIIQSANTLAGRYNKTAGVIKSWDNRERWKYPVIIDNMMNLELLFAASTLTGNKRYYDIAVSHALTTMKNHYRADYSSYHVVDYDTTAAGTVLQKTTHQGYNNESAWSRGQAWGLYGYTMCYRETKLPVFLTQAEHIASYILNHANMPKDLVPYYDFNAPGIPNEPRDASAAAIIASALYELSTYSSHRSVYKKAADKIMRSLTHKYRPAVGDSKGFLLLHSTGSKPANSEVDVPLVYADYYYLEALLRSKGMGAGKHQ